MDSPVVPPGSRPRRDPPPWLAAAVALARRPGLWPAAYAMVPARWWRRWPPVPMPSRSYVRFRLETMYGPGGRLDAGDLIRYLEWVRTMRRRAR